MKSKEENVWSSETATKTTLKSPIAAERSPRYILVLFLTYYHYEGQKLKKFYVSLFVQFLHHPEGLYPCRTVEACL